MHDRDERTTRDEGDLLQQGPFRIATVSEMTGVPEPTLRAWERRYGIPSPERTASGYRLYGAAEVAQVREMRRLCDGGMAASDAARLLSRQGRALRIVPVRADVPESRSARAAERIDDHDGYDGARAALLEAVEQFDDDGLDRELRRLVLLGDAQLVFETVLAPVLRTIGDRWHAGDLSVAHEHFASQRIGTLLRELLRLSPAAPHSDRVVLASFADDEHELGLLGVALRLSGWGLRSVFLGSRTPPAAVRSAVRAVSPKLVALSCTVAPSRVRARELLDEYGAACGDVPWIVGGAGAAKMSDLIVKLGGAVAPDDAASLRTLVRRLTRGAKR